MNDQALMTTNLPWPDRRQGKVRDVYRATLPEFGDVVVIVATDRISAFDVVMANGIPGKGKILTEISNFWFDQIAQDLGQQIQHHVISTDVDHLPDLDQSQRSALRGRTVVGRACEVVPIECVVRGYLAGSGWGEYQQNQSVCGVPLPSGLTQCDRLPQPIFTPATKAASGHDQNISFDQACDIAGRDVMQQLRQWSLAIYQMGHDHAAERGIILADTKFEFGRTPQGQLILIDEVMTPDSSRYWPAESYEPGRDQPSLDKQFVRNYLQALVDKGQWHKQPPGPTLPDEIVQQTLAKYRQAVDQLTR